MATESTQKHSKGVCHFTTSALDEWLSYESIAKMLSEYRRELAI
jgi:hypothetical protein